MRQGQWRSGRHVPQSRGQNANTPHRNFRRRAVAIRRGVPVNPRDNGHPLGRVRCNCKQTHFQWVCAGSHQITQYEHQCSLGVVDQAHHAFRSAGSPDRQEQSFQVGESTQSHRVLQQVNSVRRGRRMPAPEQQAYPANWTRYTRAIRRSRRRVSASPHLPSSEVSIERAKSDSSCACNALGSHRILAAKDKKLCSTT